MNEALCSILCGEDEWCFRTEGRSITFNQDGTGELWCRCNFNYWIAVVLEWKSLEPLDRDEQLRGQLVETARATRNNVKSPHLLGQLNLEIILAKRLPRGLTDAAFRSESYTIRIEKCNFVEPCYVKSSGSYKPRFALHLVLDTSPYPPRSEWRKPEGGPDGGQFWDHKEFVSRSSPELEKQGRTMNEPPLPGWNSCAVS